MSSRRVQSSSRKNHSHERDGMRVVVNTSEVFHAEYNYRKHYHYCVPLLGRRLFHMPDKHTIFFLAESLFFRVLLLFRSTNRLVTCVCVCVICVIYDSSKCLIEIEEGQLSHRIRLYFIISVFASARGTTNPVAARHTWSLDILNTTTWEWTNRIDKERAHFTRMNW